MCVTTANMTGRQFPSKTARTVSFFPFLFSFAVQNIAAAYPSVPGIAAATSEAEKRFQSGKALIEQNCGDCEEATRDGLQEGINEIKAVLEKGYADKLSAYQLISDAYNTIAIVYAAPDSEEQKALLEKKRVIDEQILALSPNSPRLLYECGISLENKEERLRVMRRVLAIEPTNASARAVVGKLLVKRGQVDDGIKKAIEHAEPHEKATYQEELNQLLAQHGKQKPAYGADKLK